MSQIPWPQAVDTPRPARFNPSPGRPPPQRGHPMTPSHAARARPPAVCAARSVSATNLAAASGTLRTRIRMFHVPTRQSPRSARESLLLSSRSSSHATGSRCPGCIPRPGAHAAGVADDRPGAEPVSRDRLLRNLTDVWDRAGAPNYPVNGSDTHTIWVGWMTSLDARRMLLAATSTPDRASRPGRPPTPVQAGQLTDLQLAGTACIWCATALTTEDRHEVGCTGYPARRLYGCAGCVVVGRRRLPVWPEPGCF